MQNRHLIFRQSLYIFAQQIVANCVRGIQKTCIGIEKWPSYLNMLRLAVLSFSNIRLIKSRAYLHVIALHGIGVGHRRRRTVDVSIETAVVGDISSWNW